MRIAYYFTLILLCNFSLSFAETPRIGNYKDPVLQRGLETAVEELGLSEAVQELRLGIAFVDISNPQRLRFAGLNENHLMYAASLPKIAILFGLLKRIEDRSLIWNSRIQMLAKDMIRLSSNPAATELYYMVGPDYIINALLAPKFELYNPYTFGGLWVGKEYGQNGAYIRDPIKDLAHAATPLAVARFYYLLEKGEMFGPGLTLLMKSILSETWLNHKFVKGILDTCPQSLIRILRKSGSWGTFHSDSILVEHDGKKYILVGLVNDAHGEEWLQRLIGRVDQLAGVTN